MLDLPPNDRSFRSFAKSIKNNFVASSFPPLVRNGSNDPIIDIYAKANLFAEIFSANLNLPSSIQSPPQTPILNHKMGKIFFRTILKNLDTKNQQVQTSFLA